MYIHTSSVMLTVPSPPRSLSVVSSILTSDAWETMTTCCCCRAVSLLLAACAAWPSAYCRGRRRCVLTLAAASAGVRSRQETARLCACDPTAPAFSWHDFLACRELDFLSWSSDAHSDRAWLRATTGDGVCRVGDQHRNFQKPERLECNGCLASLATDASRDVCEVSTELHVDTYLS